MCSALIITANICLKVLVLKFLFFAAATLSNKPKDVMLGTVKIPLADLIHKRTGMAHSITGTLCFSDEHTLIFLFLNIKVFLDGLECRRLQKQVSLDNSTSWLEALMSPSGSPTTQTGKES